MSGENNFEMHEIAQLHMKDETEEEDEKNPNEALRNAAKQGDVDAVRVLTPDGELVRIRPISRFHHMIFHVS